MSCINSDTTWEARQHARSRTYDLFFGPEKKGQPKHSNKHSISRRTPIDCPLYLPVRLIFKDVPSISFTSPKLQKPAFICKFISLKICLYVWECNMCFSVILNILNYSCWMKSLLWLEIMMYCTEFKESFKSIKRSSMLSLLCSLLAYLQTSRLNLILGLPLQSFVQPAWFSIALLWLSVSTLPRAHAQIILQIQIFDTHRYSILFVTCIFFFILTEQQLRCYSLLST